MSDHNRIKFSEFQAAIKSFDLAEAEKDIAEFIASHHGVLKGGCEFGAPYYINTGPRNSLVLNPMVDFRDLGPVQVKLRQPFPFDGAEFGPYDINCYEINYVEYSRQLAEFDAADDKQADSMIFDGVMTQLDAYYFWYSKLAMWIEDHSDAFVNDMEDTIIALIEFHFVDGGDTWHYHSSQFILWMVDAAGLELSADLQETLVYFAQDLFSSYMPPEPEKTQQFAQMAKWELVENLMDTKYNAKIQRSTSSPDSLQSNGAISDDVVIVASQYSERLQKHIDLQFTRDMDRRIRALQGLPELAGAMDAHAAQLAACRSSVSFLMASARLTSQLEQQYYHQLLNFLSTSKAPCFNPVQKVVLSNYDYRIDAEILMQRLSERAQRNSLVDNIYHIIRTLYGNN